MDNDSIRKLIRQIIEETHLNNSLSKDIHNIDSLFKEKYNGTEQSVKWNDYIGNVLKHAQHARGINQLTTMHLMTLRDVGHGLLKKARS